MRKINTTCGTSLLESCCWNAFGSESKGLNSNLLSQMGDDEDRKRAYEDHCRKVFKKFKTEKKISNNGMEEIPIESIREIASKFDKFSWGGDSKDNFNYLRDLPAELASLRAIEQVLMNNEEPFTKDDEILLLCSDTTDGKFCADVIKEVLIFHKLVPCKVDVKIIEDLDFEKDTNPEDKKVSEAHKGLWNYFFLPLTDEKNIDYIFNLTGGYKSLAILLGAVAYKKSDRARIFYLNEKSKRDKIFTMWFDPTSKPNDNAFGISGCITDYCEISKCKYQVYKMQAKSPSLDK